MRLVLLLLLATAFDERAVRHFEALKIDRPDTDDDAAKRVVATMLQREHWVGAFRDLADRFGRFPDELDLSVDFNLDGEEVGRTASRGAVYRISFNLKKLTGLQKQLDQFEQHKREGKEVTFKVPPLKMDRLVYHEVTHVLQGGSNAPRWFVEGMAQLVGDDPNTLYQFIRDGKRVEALDRDPSDRIEIYARGHLFWKWLDSRGAASKTFELAFVKRLPYRQALEEATNRSWANIVAEESEWSARELQKYK